MVYPWGILDYGFPDDVDDRTGQSTHCPGSDPHAHQYFFLHAGGVYQSRVFDSQIFKPKKLHDLCDAAPGHGRCLHTH